MNLLLSLSYFKLPIITTELFVKWERLSAWYRAEYIRTNKDAKYQVNLVDKYGNGMVK